MHQRSSTDPSRRRSPLSGALLAPVLLALVLLVLVPLVLVSLVLVVPRSPAHADAVPVGVWPLSPTPRVVAGFDPPDSSYGSGHRGVDLAGTPGAVVRSALAGTVTFTGVIAGKPVVVVDHGATRTTYEPVRAAVARGSEVGAGATIGRLEVPLSHCFPLACLHWGWIRNADDTYLDPLLLVGAGPVRLLPLWRATPSGPVMPADAPAGMPYAIDLW